MTPVQETKLDRVHDIVIRLEERLNNHEQRFIKDLKDHRDLIVDHERQHISIKAEVQSLREDRSKVMGALWLTGTGVFASIIAFIASYFKHN